MNANGTVGSFNINLHIDINWNAGRAGAFGSALRTDIFGPFDKTGEIEHPRDGLRALSSPYGRSPAAYVIANEAASSMVGSHISQEAASQKMDAALVDWKINTTNQTRKDRDASGQHVY